MHVDLEYITSDHFPIICSLEPGKILVQSDKQDTETSLSRIKWEDVSQDDIRIYNIATCDRLSKIIPDCDLLLCKNLNCDHSSHIHKIDSFYDNIISALYNSSVHSQSKHNTVHNVIPGWNEYCKLAHEEAREAFLLWCVNGKSKQGPIFELMTKTRAAFKSALRKCKKLKNKCIADSMAKKYLSKSTSEF